MISFNELSNILKESTPLPQLQDVNGLQRFFPELAKKKKEAKKPHDVKAGRKIVSVKKDASVVVTDRTDESLHESKKNYTVVGRFGEKKYKNIKQAERTASAPLRVPKTDERVNYAPIKHYHLTKEKMNRLETSVGYKTPKPIQKFRQFSQKIQGVVKNPIATVRKAVGGAIKSTLQPKPSSSQKPYKISQPKQYSENPKRTAGSVVGGTEEKETTTINTQPSTTQAPKKPKRTAGSVVDQI
jgi:hypothetical protein